MKGRLVVLLVSVQVGVFGPSSQQRIGLGREARVVLRWYPHTRELNKCGLYEKEVSGVG